MVWGLFRGHMLIYVAIVLAITLGWIGHSLYLDFTASEEENVLIPGQDGVLEKVNNFLTFSSAEIMSPEDHITEEQIKVYDDRVVLDVDDPIWSSFTDTNSMDPLLDVGANGIEIKPQFEDDISVGDVISYKSGNGVVIHRVIEIGTDEEGTYYIVKGDNNPIADKEKIRFEDIQGILIAVVY
ncbi:MAG: signal peptidase I [Nanoarchaeota archaeon]